MPSRASATRRSQAATTTAPSRLGARLSGGRAEPDEDHAGDQRWTLTDSEAAAFRAYLEKGGFVIVDDFRSVPYDHGGQGWDNFEANMRRVLSNRAYRLGVNYVIYGMTH